MSIVLDLQSKSYHNFREPDKTSRDKTSHAIFWHPGQNIPQRFATPDKTSHAVFVTPDKTSHAVFVAPDKTSHATFATPDKTSHTQHCGHTTTAIWVSSPTPVL